MLQGDKKFTEAVFSVSKTVSGLIFEIKRSYSSMNFNFIQNAK